MKQFIKLCFVFLLSFSLTTVTVRSYVLSGDKVQNKHIIYKLGNFTEGYVNHWYLQYAWECALVDWPTAYSSITTFQSSVTGNTLGMMNTASSSLYGKTTYAQFLGTIFTFNVYLNVGNPNISGNNVARSTANHELGHLLGLDDISYGTAIMNSNRNRSSIYLPQTDDVNGVIAAYGD